MQPTNLAKFWDAFISRKGPAYRVRLNETFCFGDSEALANELGDLVLRGIKRATAGSVWSFTAEGKRLPESGELNIVTTWSGEPLCIIETLAVDVVPFGGVGAEFAAAEGEGDGSLAYWQEAHTRYFTRECARAGRLFSEDMLVVCERFHVVFPPSDTVKPGPAPPGESLS